MSEVRQGQDAEAKGEVRFVIRAAEIGPSFADDARLATDNTKYSEITLSCPAWVRAQLAFRVGDDLELADPRSTLRRQGGPIPATPANFHGGDITGARRWPGTR